MTTASISTVAELNKYYNLLRDNILVRHGVKAGQKVRLKNAIALYQRFPNGWIKITSVKSDMVDKVKMYQGKAEFMLKALV